MTVYTPKHTDGGRERDRTEDRAAEDRDRTMGEVNHTNPYTDEPFGESQVYTRGRVAVVDGGEAGAEDEADEESEPAETIGDVDHTPREDAPSTHEVYERGGEAEGPVAPGEEPPADDAVAEEDEE